jgi:truncated hemoglobin YjbI
MSDFDEIGGHSALEKIMEDFVSRVFEDVMIGFFFRNADQSRIAKMEALFAAKLLGAKDVHYTGKSIREAHAAHPIMGGQFMRRQMILKETLADHGVSEDIISRWLEHNESMRSQVTGDRAGQCNDAAATRKIKLHSPEN